VGQIANQRAIVNRPAQRWLPTTAQDIIQMPHSFWERVRGLETSGESKQKVLDLFPVHGMLISGMTNTLSPSSR
jgi:hypothetical protein